MFHAVFRASCLRGRGVETTRRSRLEALRLADYLVGKPEGAFKPNLLNQIGTPKYPGPIPTRAPGGSESSRRKSDSVFVARAMHY